MALDDLRLSFRDEFSSLSLDTGTAATDPNLWNSSMHNGYVRSLSGNKELQIYMDADYKGLGVNPFSVNNGVLTIKAAPASSDVKNATGYSYTSGALTTQGEFSQKYGYFEVRAEVPEGKGLWPAFWLLADHGDWPPELDVMEVIGSETHKLHQTIHSDFGNAGHATYYNGKLSDSYHTFGMDWTQSNVTFYLDGKATATMATPADMHSSMYLLLNLAVGGTWPGSPDATTNWADAEYNIDYVRVYQHTGIAGSGGVLNPDGSVYVPPPVTQLSGLIISNGTDMTGMTGAKFVAPDSGAGTTTTYTASQLALGTAGGATLTVAYDAQKNVTAANNGNWNDIKNGAYTSDIVKSVTLNNFVGVSVTMNGNQDATVTVKNAKRGTIATTGGADRITVAAFSNGITDNSMAVNSGDGNDIVTFTGAANTRADIVAGGGNDIISFNGQASGNAKGGDGDDSFIIRSGGAISLGGGDGIDSYDLAVGNRVTIADFRLGEDKLTLNGVAASAINVRNTGGNTYVDVNGAATATLTGVSLSGIDLGLAEAPVVMPVFDCKTATPSAFLTPDASFTGWPVTHCKLSNGGDISVAGGSSFTAFESGANSSKSYGASQIGLGTAAGTTTTVAYDAQKNVTVTNNGAWGGIKNVALRSGAMTKMTVSNFMGVDIDMNANQSGTVTIADVMRGSVATGGGSDVINVTGKSDGGAANLMTISAGNGTNAVNYSGTSGNRAAIITGSGTDTITIAGQADGAINAGAGDDRVNVRSTGTVAVTGGAGSDIFSFIAGAHATIADFKAGEDRIEFSGVSAAGVRIRTDGSSTLIDLNGSSAVVLSGVALNAGQINLGYV